MEAKKEARKLGGKTGNSKDQGKDKDFTAQLKAVFQYLYNNTATASMVTAATGIPQKDICRFKRYLENKGKLWEVEKRQCKKTGFNAWYLTTNPNNVPDSSQLMLFDL